MHRAGSVQRVPRRPWGRSQGQIERTPQPRYHIGTGAVACFLVAPYRPVGFAQEHAYQPAESNADTRAR